MEPAGMFQQGIYCLHLVEQELLLFAAFWVLVGTVDEMAVDCCWAWFRLSGRASTGRISLEVSRAPLKGHAAVLIACWQEEQVIAHTIRHALSAWRQTGFTLYIGCYGNDSATVAAAMSGAGGDNRVRVIIHDREGPTTKADCLNRLYHALCEDERRRGCRYRSVLLHDSEDMVHPAELAVVDGALAKADFIQLPVRPEPQVRSRWVGGHYLDEFTEAHAKSLVVRDVLGAAVPAAGVGCGFARDILERITRRRRAEGSAGPFAAECLTEDYELGVLVWREGGRARFLRVRDEKGQLVATRAYFPATFEDSIRQKMRWVHGIAFQGWDRLGWSRLAWRRPGRVGKLADAWMAMRDRRGPLTAIVLASSYALLIVELLLGIVRVAGLADEIPVPKSLNPVLTICLASFVWRCGVRAGFTAREYGAWEGVCAILRIPVANLIAIFAGQRALASYIRTLNGGMIVWDKTRHDAHPAAMSVAGGPVL
ncbi:adsorption protein B [Novosphingobium sp. ST904]|nr:adsorption protein B [Novosphingobium sp. ST904]